MRTHRRIVSIVSLVAMLTGLAIALGGAWGAAASPDSPTANAGWGEVGPNSASGEGISKDPNHQAPTITGSPSVAIGPNGLPVVAWRHVYNGQGEIYVRRWNGTTWAELGANSASAGGISHNSGNSRYPSVAIGPDNMPIVAWEDSSAGNWEIYVRRWNGTTWAEMSINSAQAGGISKNLGDSWSPSLAIGPDGRPAIAWSDNSAFYRQIFVRRWNGTTWAEVGLGSATSGISQTESESSSPSLAIDPDNRLVVAWHDNVSGSYEVFVRRWNGTNWAEIGAGSASGMGISGQDEWSIDPSVAVGSDGKPIIAWWDANSGHFEIYVRRWSGSAWVEMGAGSASGEGISQNGVWAQLPSLAIGPDDAPIVAWDGGTLESNDIYVRRWNGSTWAEMDTGSATGGGISDDAGQSEYASLAIGPDGVPVVAWRSLDNDNYATYVRRYVTACHLLVLSHSGDGGDPVAEPAKSEGCPGGQYLAGESIALSASPAGGWRVKKWSGTDDDGSTATTNTVTMPADVRVVSVNYEPIPLTATTTPTPTLTPTATPTATPPPGATLTPTPTATTQPALDWQIYLPVGMR